MMIIWKSYFLIWEDSGFVCWLHVPFPFAPPCSGMKLLITPLLSGLLENDFNKMTEFDDFFKEIEKINRKKVITILYSLSSLLCSGETSRENISQTLWFESHLWKFSPWLFRHATCTYRHMIDLTFYKSFICEILSSYQSPLKVSYYIYMFMYSVHVHVCGSLHDIVLV